MWMEMGNRFDAFMANCLGRNEQLSQYGQPHPSYVFGDRDAHFTCATFELLKTVDPQLISDFGGFMKAHPGMVAKDLENCPPPDHGPATVPHSTFDDQQMRNGEVFEIINLPWFADTSKGPATPRPSEASKKRKMVDLQLLQVKRPKLDHAADPAPPADGNNHPSPQIVASTMVDEFLEHHGLGKERRGGRGKGAILLRIIQNVAKHPEIDMGDYRKLTSIAYKESLNLQNYGTTAMRKVLGIRRGVSNIKFVQSLLEALSGWVIMNRLSFKELIREDYVAVRTSPPPNEPMQEYPVVPGDDPSSYPERLPRHEWNVEHVPPNGPQREWNVEHVPPNGPQREWNTERVPSNGPVQLDPPVLDIHNPGSSCGAMVENLDYGYEPFIGEIFYF